MVSCMMLCESQAVCLTKSNSQLTRFSLLFFLRSRLHRCGNYPIVRWNVILQEQHAKGCAFLRFQVVFEIFSIDNFELFSVVYDRLAQGYAEEIHMVRKQLFSGLSFILHLRVQFHIIFAYI